MKPKTKARGYRKDTHKPYCKCPICRSARGERKRTRCYIHITLSEELIQALRIYAKENGVSVASVAQQALEAYLIDAQKRGDRS